VLDRTNLRRLGEPLYRDVCTVFQNTGSGPVLVGGRYGLGSKDFTPVMVKAVFDNLRGSAPKNHFTVGITDDVSHTSLDLGADIDAAPRHGEVQILGLGATAP